MGRVDRFASAAHLSAYLGLHPSVRQSGDGPAYHGRIIPPINPARPWYQINT
ncbi:transposase [Falsirhodobacter sp. 1013]|uniref:transposase n=1 Tax=Falsirhodobacter sp. 1013 TaxID=3417566 RepID=UPI003EBAABAC